MTKDLRAELRTKEAINASLGFAIVILLLFSFAFDPEADTTKALSGGLLWIVLPSPHAHSEPAASPASCLTIAWTP